MPNAREAGEILATGALPVPIRLTVGVAPEVLLFKLKTPARFPRAVGVNVMLAEQLAPAARLLPQLFVWLKSPVTLKPEIVSAAIPVLDRVTLCAPLDVPTRCAE